MMATSQREICNTCKRESGQVTCKGCSKTYCLNHFNEHRQQLETQFDDIEVNRDVFRQNLTESIAHLEKHILIRQVNQWENESYDKIKQVAAEARQILTQYMKRVTTQLETKLQTVTAELRASRNKNEFNELDLAEWKTTLTNMKDELQDFPTIKVVKRKKSLISHINVAINEENSEYYSPDSSICQYCNQHCFKPDYKTHRKNCLQNPDNQKNTRDANANGNSYNNSDSREQLNDSYDDVGIPCEWCFESIPIEIYQRHAEACRDEEHRKLLDKHRAQEETYGMDMSYAGSKPVRTTNPRQSKVIVKTPSATATNQCKFCKNIMSAEGLSYHQLVCVKNPTRNRN